MKRLKVRLVDPDTRCAVEIKENSMIGIDITVEGELIAYKILDTCFNSSMMFGADDDYKELEIQVVE